MTARRLFLVAFAVALPIGVGCGGGGGGGGGGTPEIACTDGDEAAANAVTLTCGGATNSTTERVDVVLGGPASGTTTLRGLNFDVIYEPANLEYVPAATDTSPLFSPNALVAVQPYNNELGRLVVSIQEYGSVVAPVSVGTGQHVVLSLSFRRAAGATFGPTPLTLENAEATAALPTIGFGSGLALSYQ